MIQGEGLPMMITLVLSSNMRKMIKNNVLVRKLVGIETAGNINVLLTDKTGTLTKGKLEVSEFVTASLRRYNNVFELQKKGIYEIAKTSMLVNNESNYDGDVIGGNTTDKALANFFKEPVEKDVIKVIPFDSKNKFSMVTLRSGLGLIKGAPEKIIPYCTKYYDDDGNIKSLLSKREINRDIEQYTKKGIRVLVMASFKENVKSLTYIGFVAIKDEIRDDVKETIETVKNAHINIIMITGDNKETAINIAEELNLLEGGIVLTSSELDMKTDEEIKKILPSLKVIARALPQDKSRLVRICQEMDLVVGMTGDGVNDAPALKQADVGFAMGSGTEVAKEASDIVLLDNSFNSIGTSILYGRTIFKSIRRFIIFQLTVNLCAVSLSIVGPFIGIETPVTVIQMLWINMVMDTLAGLAFSFEPPLKEYMEEHPKKKDEQIVNKYMIEAILFTGIYSSILCIIFLKSNLLNALFGNNQLSILTAFFGLFIFVSIFNCFNARTNRLNIFANLSKNKVFLFIISLIVVIQLILIYFGGTLFRTNGLNFKELIAIILLATTVIPIDFLRKVYLRKKNNYEGV